MKPTKDLYEKITYLNKLVKDNLRKKGVVVPVQQKDGSIKIGNFFVVKNSTGFYSINNIKHSIIVDNINLPQTAILIANKLALGKYLDMDILKADQYYGYAFFDEHIHSKSSLRSLAEKKYERAEIMAVKSEISKNKKIYYKNIIKTNFQKLIEFR